MKAKATKRAAPKKFVPEVVADPTFRVHLMQDKSYTVKLNVGPSGYGKGTHVNIEAPCGNDAATERGQLKFLCESILKILAENP